MSRTRLQELVQGAIKGVTKEDWACYCRYVTNIENSYWERNEIMKDVVENLIINLGDTDSSGDSAVVPTPKMWNHLCLISFPYSASKCTDVFGIECSVKFPPPRLSISGDFSWRAHSTCVPVHFYFLNPTNP
jgi:hypothetical protein